MSIEDTKVVDLIYADDGLVKMAISDHLEWSVDLNEHLYLLQSKINTYIAFVETGQFNETYPLAKDSEIMIKLVCKYEPNDVALEFMSEVKQILNGIDISLDYEIL